MDDNSEWEPYLADVRAFLDAREKGTRPLHPDGRPFTDDEICQYQVADDLIGGIFKRHGIVPRKVRPRRKRRS